MGPPVKRDGNAAASAALRSESQLSPAHGLAPSTDQLEWSSPTYIRARSRPGNLHSYMRSYAGASPRPFRAPGSATSSSNGGASPRHQRPSKVRSQSTRSTQTIAPGDPDDSDVPHAPLLLGSYGDVHHMPIDTVEMLIAALEDRRQELQQASANQEASAAAVMRNPSTAQPEKLLPTKARAKVKKTKCAGGDSTISGRDAVPADGEHTQLILGEPLVRSRSYEALVQLEQILEARHQQLMRDGTFDEFSNPSLRGCSESDLKEEIRKLQQSIRRDHGEQQMQR